MRCLRYDRRLSHRRVRRPSRAHRRQVELLDEVDDIADHGLGGEVRRVLGGADPADIDRGGLGPTALAASGVVIAQVYSDDGRLLDTTVSVVAGITYNFLPFMILPLYASLERIDPRLLEAGYDLYGRRRDVFFRVTLPLSMPGVVAGSLLTFIPAAGDFINAQLLGTPKQFMIGNVIQSRYLVVNDYPTAAALSFLLMAFMLIIVLIWARIAGTEALLGTEGEAR